MFEMCMLWAVDWLAEYLVDGWSCREGFLSTGFYGTVWLR